MFDIDRASRYRSPVTNRRAGRVAILVMAGAIVASLPGRAAVWERSQWTEAPVADAVAPGDRRLWNGRIVLRAPGLSSDRAAPIAAEIEARARELFETEEWSVPFTVKRPLLISLIFNMDGAFSRFSGPETPGDPAIAVNVRDRTTSEAVGEIMRDAALIALRTASPRADPLLAAAAARALSLPGELLNPDREEVAIWGGAPEGSLSAPGGEIFGAAWILEMSRRAGAGFLRRAWSSRNGSPDLSFDSLSAFYTETTGRSAAEALRVALERLYLNAEVFAGSATLSDADLVSGAMNASSPGLHAWRFFSTPGSVPEGRTFAWPEDAAEGFALLRYEEGMPADLVRFRPGDSKTLPLSGIARIDWVIPGGERPGSSISAPVTVTRVPDFPVTGLTAQVHAASAEGVTLDWRTSSHRDLSGWAVLRSEADEGGRMIRSTPEWVPSQTEDRDGAGYVYVDRAATPGHFYRYDVWAVTVDGALSRAFRATVQAR